MGDGQVEIKSKQGLSKIIYFASMLLKRVPQVCLYLILGPSHTARLACVYTVCDCQLTCTCLLKYM